MNGEAPPMADTLEIHHDDGAARGAFHIERNGSRVAEMTYAWRDERRVTIDHTFVDDSLRGQGVARKLLDAAVAWARATGIRVRATCEYARGQFDKDPSIGDVLER